MRALTRTSIGSIHAARNDGDRVVGQRAVQAVARAAVSEAVDEHRVDIELEPERQHGRTVAPPLGCEQERSAACYFADEEGAGEAVGASR